MHSLSLCAFVAVYTTTRVLPATTLLPSLSRTHKNAHVHASTHIICNMHSLSAFLLLKIGKNKTTASTSDQLLGFFPDIHWSYLVKYWKLPVTANPAVTAQSIQLRGNISEIFWFKLSGKRGWFGQGYIHKENEDNAIFWERHKQKWWSCFSTTYLFLFLDCML